MNSDLDTPRPGTGPGLPALSYRPLKARTNRLRTGLCAAVFCVQIPMKTLTICAYVSPSDSADLTHNLAAMPTAADPAHRDPVVDLPPQIPAFAVLARLTTDLDARGRFAAGQLLLTATHLCHWQSELGWRSSALAPGLALRHTDLSGVATLDLVDANGLL